MWAIIDQAEDLYKHHDYKNRALPVFLRKSHPGKNGKLYIILFNNYRVKKPFNFADRNNKKLFVLRILLSHAIFNLNKVNRKIVFSE